MRGWGFAAALTFVLTGCGAERGSVTDLPPPSPPSPVRAPRVAVAAAPRPAWRAARVIADAPSLPERATAALPGDTLASLAARAEVSPGALAVANHLAPGATLAPGQRLIVPAGRWHLVKPGETGIAIARAYRAAWPRVIRANGLVPPYALEVGDRLLIPAPPPPKRPAPVPATIEARAHAFNLDIDALLGAEPHVKPSAGHRMGRRARVPPTAGEVPAKPAEVAGPQVAPDHATDPAVRAAGDVRVVGAIHLDWPLIGRILSAFGPKPGGRFNDGINIAAIAGAPVHAAADGTVAYAGSGVAAFGGLILIRHAGGWLTAYAHCEALLVAKGDTVRAGQTIARAGATGEVDQPQLHFEVRRGRVPVDPVKLLPERP